MPTHERPFYNPSFSYEKNYDEGPFGDFANGKTIEKNSPPLHIFLGFEVYTQFGIPAGPLLNSNFVSKAFEHEFNICVYKTVRSRKYPCHDWPNILAIHEKEIIPGSNKKLIADTNFTGSISITNSFGVPSMAPEIWQPDMEKAVQSAGIGQIMIGSFQGTPDGSGSEQKYINDCAKTALMVKETGARILEFNTSCPNEGKSTLFRDIEKSKCCIKAIRKAIGPNVRLIIKIGYCSKDDPHLEKFVEATNQYIDAYAAINTVSAEVINKDGSQALPGKGRESSGICGFGIKKYGMETVESLSRIRKRKHFRYEIIAVGGIGSYSDLKDYLNLGAIAGLAATAPIFKPSLGREIYREEVKSRM